LMCEQVPIVGDFHCWMGTSKLLFFVSAFFLIHYLPISLRLLVSDPICILFRFMVLLDRTIAGHFIHSFFAAVACANHPHHGASHDDV